MFNVSPVWSGLLEYLAVQTVPCLLFAFVFFVAAFLGDGVWALVVSGIFALMAALGFLCMFFVQIPLPYPLDRATGQNRQD